MSVRALKSKGAKERKGGERNRETEW